MKTMQNRKSVTEENENKTVFLSAERILKGTLLLIMKTKLTIVTIYLT